MSFVPKSSCTREDDSKDNWYISCYFIFELLYFIKEYIRSIEQTSQEYIALARKDTKRKDSLELWQLERCMILLFDKRSPKCKIIIMYASFL